MQRIEYQKRDKYIGIFLSSLLFFILASLTFLYTDLRIIDEGGKELMGMLNHGGLFLLDIERFPLLLSRILPFLGMVLKAPLESIFYLYSLNLVVFSFIYYLYRISKKDYYSGITLASFQIIGISYTFFIQPFSEHLHAIFFCIIITDIIHRSETLSTKKYLAVIILTIFASVVYPTCSILALLTIFLSRLNLRTKVSLAIICCLSVFISLLTTIIDVEEKTTSVHPFLFFQNAHLFIKTHFELIILSATAFSILLIQKKNLLLFILFAIGIYPYLIYNQIKDYQLLLPVGIFTIIIYQYQKNNFKYYFLALIISAFFYNIYKIQNLAKEYQLALNTTLSVIDKTQMLDGNKFIIKSENPFYRTSELANIKLDFNEIIRHVSILFSSTNKYHKPVVIDSYQFCNRAFFITDTLCKIVEDECIIKIMNTLYQHQQPYLINYEYYRYFTTENAFNKNYFKIDMNQSYRILPSIN